MPPQLLTGNTLEGLAALKKHGLLPADTADRLQSAYVFLRRVEHFLQILEDRQVHRIPDNPELRTALARRVQLATSGEGDFFERLEETRRAVRAAFTRYLLTENAHPQQHSRGKRR